MLKFSVATQPIIKHHRTTLALIQALSTTTTTECHHRQFDHCLQLRLQRSHSIIHRLFSTQRTTTTVNSLENVGAQHNLLLRGESHLSEHRALFAYVDALSVLHQSRDQHDKGSHCLSSDAHFLASRAAEQVGAFHVAEAHMILCIKLKNMVQTEGGVNGQWKRAMKQRLTQLNEARLEAAEKVSHNIKSGNRGDDEGQQHFPYVVYPWSVRDTCRQLSRSINRDTRSFFEAMTQRFSTKIEIGESTVGTRGVFAKRALAKGEVISVEKPLVSAVIPQQEAVVGEEGEIVHRTRLENCILDQMKRTGKCAPLIHLLIPKIFELQYEKSDVFEQILRLSSWADDRPLFQPDFTIPWFSFIGHHNLALSYWRLATEGLVMKRNEAFAHDLTESFSFEWYCQMHHILAVNTFMSHCHDGGIPHGINLYGLTSYYNHSCAANARTRFCDSSETEIMITADRSIDAGEEIFINYLGDECAAMESSERRAMLHSTYHFHCMCPRCVAEQISAATNTTKQ